VHLHILLPLPTKPVSGDRTTTVPTIFYCRQAKIEKPLDNIAQKLSGTASIIRLANDV
jgi:hypothetical protein